MTSRIPVLLAAALALLPGPAAAQPPPPVRTDTAGVPPMPTPAPVQATPPDVSGPASVPAWQPPPDPGAAASPVVTGPLGPVPTVTPVVPPATGGPTPDDAAAPPRRPLWREGQPLIGGNGRIGAYIAPTFKLTGFGRAPGLMLGADFAVILNERFLVGAAGTALVTPLAAQRSDGRTFNMRVQYAGITLAVALLQVRFFSLSIGGLVGGGRVCLNDERLDRCVNRAAMFVAEPELGLSFAVTRVLRLVLSGGYRFAVAQQWSGPENRTLGGWSVTLGVRLGRF